VSGLIVVLMCYKGEVQVPSAQGGVSEQGSGTPARPGRSGRPLGQSWCGARPCITPHPQLVTVYSIFLLLIPCSCYPSLFVFPIWFGLLPESVS
jgi:hypothetical protein